MSIAAATIPATGSFCWYELNTRTLEGVKSFYGELFGWKTSPSQMSPEYHHWHDANGDMFGGIMNMSDPRWGDVPSHWMGYITVDDCIAMAEKVTALGGNVCVPPTHIQTVGDFCVINDPSGPVLSLIQLEDPKPLPPVIVWNECMTRDVGKAKQFYTTLLGWTTEVTPMGDEGDYTMWRNGETRFGGMFEMNGPQFEQVPPHWLHYIGVNDIDGIAGRIPAAGGKVVHGPCDIPGNMGRICVFSDPGGGHIAMYQSPQG
jgi:hypothetical protein